MGAVRALSDLVLSVRTHKGKMWAAAALGNMAAPYEAVPADLTATARSDILAREGLVPALVEMVKAGPVHRDAATDRWPSTALKSQRFYDGVSAWGAAQALGHLAAGSPEGKAKVEAARAIQPLCALAKSPDEIEKAKGLAAVEQLGVEDCEKHIDDDEL